MDKIDTRLSEIRQFCIKNADPAIEKKYARYFTEGYDAYGIDPKIFESQRDKWLEQWKNDFTLNDYLLLGEKLIATGKYEEASFAVSFIYSLTHAYKPETFEKLGEWFDSGIKNWAHTDVLAGKALSHFFINRITCLDALKNWQDAKSKWKRRAIPVTLVELLKTDIQLENMLSLIEPLMQDKDKFVQKGLGWFLREAWKIHPEKTEDFLLKWKETCGRTIIQYATEKMDKENRKKFRKTKK